MSDINECTSCGKTAAGIRYTGRRAGSSLCKSCSSMKRIRRAIGSMPGGGTIHTRITSPLVTRAYPGEVTLEDVAEYLEAMKDQLEVVYEDFRESENELKSLKRDIQGFRNLMGVSDE